MLAVGSVVIRVGNLDAQIQFWSNALDYAVREPVGDDFALLHPREGCGPNISLDLHPSDRVLPPRIHLDLYAQDQLAEVARLRELGARDVQWDKQPPDADYIIMEDPEGNRFCIIDAADWPGWSGHESKSVDRQRVDGGVHVVPPPSGPGMLEDP